MVVADVKAIKQQRPRSAKAGAYNFPTVGYKWPGLYKEEQLVGNSGSLTGAQKLKHPLYFEYWSGVDCIGLVLNSLRYAERPNGMGDDGHSDNNPYWKEYGVIQRTPLPGVSLEDLVGEHNLHTYDGMYKINQEKFFSSDNSNNVFYWKRLPPTKGVVSNSDELIHKGDVAWYDGHISIVYSDRWGESIRKDEYDTHYDIIHANGSPNRTYALPGELPNDPDFARKVQIDSIGTAINSKTLKKPIGFGRIKVWE
jgi:hypothetical protein